MHWQLGHHLRAALLALVLALLSVSAAAAQVQQLDYGESVIGTIEAGVPPVQYTFVGETGDLVTIEVTGVTSGLIPSLILISPGQTRVITASPDSIDPDSSRVRLTSRLRETGVYLISVGSRDQVAGDFLLALDARVGVPAATLSPGILAQVEIAPGAAPQFFTFPLSPTAPTLLTITNESDGFAFIAEVRDDEGQTVSRLERVVRSTQLEFPPAADTFYELTIAAATPDLGGTIVLALSNQGTMQVLPAGTEDVFAIEAEALPTATPSSTPTAGPTPTFTPLSPDSPSPFGIQAGGSANPTPTFTPISPNLTLAPPDPNTTATPTFTPIPRELLPATVVLPTRAATSSSPATALPAQASGANDTSAPNWEGARTSGDDGCINSAAFIADVTIPDGTPVNQGEPFVKTWRLQNTGSCAWDSRYSFVKVDGDLRSGFLEDTISMPPTAPGATVDVSIVLAALISLPEQRAVFQIRDPNGFFFGPQPFVIVNVNPR